MEQLRIFVSSTCYDLAQERTDIHEGLSACGHHVLLSEHTSFPVHPDLGTVENCMKAVRGNTDVFVLVVGGRRGSLDPESGKPVTNVEYDAAIQSDCVILVFVSRPVLGLLDIWEKNPEADFSPHVDYPEVFTFIKRLREDQRWIFPFDRAQEIVGTLKVQLSALMRDLLQQRRIPDPLIPPQLSTESTAAQRLVRDRKPYWQYKLASELLSTKLHGIERDFRDIARGTFMFRTHHVSNDASGWLRDHVLGLTDVLTPLNRIINCELVQSFGSSDQPADPVEILRVAEKVAAMCRRLRDWEVEIRGAQLPGCLDHIRQMMFGWAEHLWLEMPKLRDFLCESVGHPDPDRTYRLNLLFESPENMNEVLEEMDRIAKEY